MATKGWKELELQELRWVQQGMGTNYALQTADGEVIATMRRPKWWNWGYTEIDAPGNRWRFETKYGWTKTRIVITAVGTDEKVAEFTFRTFSWKHYTGGELVFNDGRTFRWQPNNFWGTKYVWTTVDGTPILGYQTGGFLRLAGEMSIPDNAADIPSLNLLMFLGWYLVVHTYESSATVT